MDLVFFHLPLPGAGNPVAYDDVGADSRLRGAQHCRINRRASIDICDSVFVVGREQENLPRSRAGREPERGKPILGIIDDRALKGVLDRLESTVGFGQGQAAPPGKILEGCRTMAGKISLRDLGQGSIT